MLIESIPNYKFWEKKRKINSKKGNQTGTMVTAVQSDKFVFRIGMRITHK